MKELGRRMSRPAYDDLPLQLPVFKHEPMIAASKIFLHTPLPKGFASWTHEQFGNYIEDHKASGFVNVSTFNIACDIDLVAQRIAFTQSWEDRYVG